MVGVVRIGVRHRVVRELGPGLGRDGMGGSIHPSGRQWVVPVAPQIVTGLEDVHLQADLPQVAGRRQPRAPGTDDADPVAPVQRSST